ncbi:retrotransposon protein, putative, ty1-copia subclass [Tanacetum coccineum]
MIPLPYPVASQAARDAYEALNDAQNEVACLMLGSMSPELQMALENYKAYDMIQELKTMFEEQAKQELFETVKAFHAYKQEDGQSNDKKKPQGAKVKDKGNNKLVYAPKAKIPPPPKKDNATKDSFCHHYKEGLRESRKLKHGALSLYMGNGMRAAVEAIRSFDLILPSGLIIILDNCLFAPTVTMGVVSISRLLNNGYIHTFTNYGISVLKDNVFYFNAIPRDGIYEIDMHNLYPNVSSVYNVSNKRAKHALDSYYLWHCRLRHINKKRMNMLQRDGLLQPTHNESHEKCNCGIVSQLTPPYTPQHNGVSERRNQTLLDMVRSMMNLTTLPKSFWGYALETTARILNMVPTKKVDRMPYEIWHGKAPKLSYLKETMGYYFYYPLKNKIFVSRNAEFFENSFMVQEAGRSHRLLKISESDKGLELIQEEDTQPSENTSETHNEVAPIEVEPQNVRVPICISARIPQVPNRYEYYDDIEEYELGDLDEPPNYKAALANPESEK